jgi:hypothetical protein
MSKTAVTDFARCRMLAGRTMFVTFHWELPATGSETVLARGLE